MARKREERANKESRKNPKSRSPSESPCQDKNFHSLKHQLSAMKLTLREIPGDGNCLFGALADQLDGTTKTHMKHRLDVVTYMRNHREDFEPFVEDDEPFEKHLSNLAELGTYGGNECIVAFAKLNGVKVVIHQLNAPLWQIDGSNGKDNVKELHISYHNGDHYNSVRRTGDCTSNPSNIKLSVKKSSRPESVSKKKGSNPYEEGKPLPYYNDECTVDGMVACSAENKSFLNCQLIMDQTGINDYDTIQHFFVANGHDVTETIDALLNYVIHDHKGDEPTTVRTVSDDYENECLSSYGDDGKDPLLEPQNTLDSLKELKKTQMEIQQKKLKSATLSSSKKKELKKQMRKYQKNETKRIQALNEHHQHLCDENSCWDHGDETIIVKDIGCLSI